VVYVGQLKFGSILRPKGYWAGVSSSKKTSCGDGKVFHVGSVLLFLASDQLLVILGLLVNWPRPYSELKAASDGEVLEDHHPGVRLVLVQVAVCQVDKLISRWVTVEL
jgi:hypothetical protein